MGEYRTAVVCRRGHVYTTNASSRPAANRCETCGAGLLSRCPTCAAAIRGSYETPGAVLLGAKYAPPDFCYQCGGPFPWASRQARIWELQNLLDEEELDEADRLTAREQLHALLDPDLDEDEQEERWRRIRKSAPGLMSSGRRIIESVVAAGVKSQLGL